MSEKNIISIQIFQKKILTWYEKNKRNLPWRQTTDPYKILVSEVMLQQTQVDRVIPYYERWLKEFPDVQALAKADKQKILQLWSGLGYNNRALRLQKLAQQMIEQYKGKFPSQYESLLELPGIGPYTAAAIQAFAFNKTAPVIDTNIRRVFIHELQLKESISMEELKALAMKATPEGKARLWNNALMDYGAMEKTAKATGIESLSKQPKFKGSDRQVRGFILKQLAQKRKITLQEIQTQFPEKNVQKILEKMEKEKIVAINKSKIQIA